MESGQLDDKLNLGLTDDSNENEHDPKLEEDDEKVLQSLDPALLVEQPDPMDVICGRGKSGPHPGNQRFQKLIAENKEIYQRSKRREDKSRISQQIVAELSNGATPSRFSTNRFLLKDPKSQLWYDAGLEYAREKVSHALRSRPLDAARRKARNQKKKKKVHSPRPEINETAQKLISEQQLLLKSMIDKKVFPGWI